MSDTIAAARAEDRRLLAARRIALTITFPIWVLGLGVAWLILLYLAVANAAAQHWLRRGA